MAELFVVIRRYGENFDTALPLEQHAEWEAHRTFMNALEAEGFVRLGGPLPGSRDVLLIFRADSPDEIESRLADDRWTRNGFLHTTRISAWDLRIGVV